MTKPASTPGSVPGQTLRTCVAAAGLALMAGGFWMAWPPLALIVPGALLLALAVAGALISASKPQG